MTRAGDIEEGDYISYPPYEGLVIHRIDHYRSLGDGSEDYVTLIVVQGQGIPRSDPCGPMKASTEVQKLHPDHYHQKEQG